MNYIVSQELQHLSLIDNVVDSLDTVLNNEKRWSDTKTNPTCIELTYPNEITYSMNCSGILKLHYQKEILKYKESVIFVMQFIKVIHQLRCCMNQMLSVIITMHLNLFRDPNKIL